MFSSKKDKLFDVPEKISSEPTPMFVAEALKDQAITTSHNGAKKYSTTGNSFVDQFGSLGAYKNPRSFEDISKDCETLWADSKINALHFMFYVRMITRITSLADGTKTAVSQRGAELRHEGIMRMIWLHMRSPETFWNNIGLWVAVGSWKDIITMLQYDLVYNGWDGRKLDWDKFGKVIVTGLNNENTNNLLKKYLPTIKAKSACKTVESQADTIISKWICSLLFGPKDDKGATYKQYRKLKTSGTANEWQKLISQKKHDLIDFNTIHGRALKLLVRSKFLENQGLKEKYEKWITKPETEAKFTGFVHELFEKLPDMITDLSRGEAETINKQFATLVEKGGSVEATKLIVVRDTSGSMGSICKGTNLSCLDMGKALALYFSEFLTGKFANAWIEFADNATVRTWKGNSPIEKWFNDESESYGSTNFQSVISLFAKMKKSGVPESEFPTGILCISDGEFNPSQLGKTNVEDSLTLLRNAGFSDDFVNNFVIVLWNVIGGAKGHGGKFDTHGDVANVFYFSGFSPATIGFLTSKIRTASELFEAAMDQEILNMLEVK